MPSAGFVMNRNSFVHLFDAAKIAPNVNAPPKQRNGYPEQIVGKNTTIYYPGGYGTLKNVNETIQTSGPSGMFQAGGGRSLRKTMRNTMQKKERRNKRKAMKRTTKRYNKYSCK
jgi:hypothetical protein